MTTTIEVDARKRVSLGALATASQYLAEVDDDGVITLVPARIVSETELRLLGRPDILGAVELARRESVSGERPVRRPR